MGERLNIAMVFGNVKPKAELPEPDGFRYGGLVSLITGLTFSVSECGYYMQGRPIVSPFTVKTLDPADPTHDRIDVFAVDITGSVVVIKGTPAAEPQKPSVDPTSQLELTFVLIPAQGTEPSGVTDEIIYDENVEWTPSTYEVTVNFDATTDPFSGSKCADVGSIGTSDRITFTASANKNFADYETLTAFLKLKEATNKQHFLLCEFLLSGVPVSDAVILLSTSVSLAWQSIAVPLSAFQFSGSQFDAVRFRWSKSGQQVDHAGFYLDLVKLEAGIEQPSTGQDGKDGEDGLSAYEIAVLNGFEGTEPEWLESLKGDDGTPGADGANGQDGDDGITPHIGANGNWYIDTTDTGIPATGDDGREVEFRENAGYVEWRYVGDVSWTQLYEIPTPAADTAFDVYIDFLDTTEFVYNCPAALKFTQVISESTAPTLSVALNTNMAQFDKLTITPAAVGLVILKGELI